MWIYIKIYHILCLIIIIHHKRHHFITRTTSKHETVWCWTIDYTKKMSVSSFGSFIELIKVQFTKTWVSPRRRLCALVFRSTRAAPRHCRHDIRRFGVPIGSTGGRKCVRRLTRRINSRGVRRWVPSSWLEQLEWAQTVRKMQKREDIYSRIIKCSKFPICHFKYPSKRHTKPRGSDYLSTSCNHMLIIMMLSKTTGISQWNR